MTGVNTNSGVLPTTMACSRDYGVFIDDDCIDTIDGSEGYLAILKEVAV